MAKTDMKTINLDFSSKEEDDIKIEFIDKRVFAVTINNIYTLFYQLGKNQIIEDYLMFEKSFKKMLNKKHEYFFSTKNISTKSNL
jgi:hypothetical protein